MAEPEKLIPLHGGYRKLKSFQVAQLAYDVTVRFCDRYIEKRSRTHDQMVQAARSGVQNIAEGSAAMVLTCLRRWGLCAKIAFSVVPVGTCVLPGSDPALKRRAIIGRPPGTGGGRR